MRQIETRVPVDLYLAAGLAMLAALVVALDAPAFLVVPLGLLLVLLLPGYAILSVVFPEAVRLTLFRRVPRGVPSAPPPPARALAGLERIALSGIASVAFTGFAGFALTAMPDGLTLGWFVGVSAGFTVLACLLGLYLRFSLEESRRPRFLVPVPEFHPPTGMDILMQVLLVASLLALGTVLLVWPPEDPNPEAFTSFYVQGPSDAKDCFPRFYRDGIFSPIYVPPTCPDAITNVTVGVVNHGDSAQNYTIYVEWREVTDDGSPPGFSPQASWSFELEPAPKPVERHVRERLEQQYEVVYDLPPPTFPGSQRLVFQLHIDSSQAFNRDDPADSLILQIERLPDATPP